MLWHLEQYIKSNQVIQFIKAGGPK